MSVKKKRVFFNIYSKLNTVLNKRFSLQKSQDAREILPLKKISENFLSNIWSSEKQEKPPVYKLDTFFLGILI